MNLEGGRSQKAQGDATQDRGLDLRSMGKPWKVLCRGKGMAWLGMLLRNPTHAADGEYIWGRQTEQSRGEKTSLDKDCRCVGERLQGLRVGWWQGRWDTS